MDEQNGFAMVARETVENGIIPWVGRRYEKRVRGMIRTVDHDPRARLVPKRLFEAYRAHPQANSRITDAQARELGLADSGRPEPPFLHRLRRMLGNPDT